MCGLFIHLLLPLVCHDQQQNITGWWKSQIIYLFTKNEGLQGLYFFFFPHFQGPVRAMYQSVGKCFKIHLRAASFHKISGGLGCPLTPRRFLRAGLAPRPIRWHFRLVRAPVIYRCLTSHPDPLGLLCHYTTEAKIMYVTYVVCDVFKHESHSPNWADIVSYGLNSCRAIFIFEAGIYFVYRPSE